MVLFIDACVRKESRTRRLAERLLNRLGNYETVKLNNTDLKPLNDEELERRTLFIEKGDYDNPMFDHAKQFASADVIVIAAPFWDGSFPAALKVYIENIYVTGIVSKYGSDGTPIGLCRARKLYYVTTAGGPYIPDFSYEYIKQLSTVYFGITEAKLIKAEMLDVQGADPERILRSAEAEIDSRHDRLFSDDFLEWEKK